MIDTITNPKTVTFSQCIEEVPQKPHNSRDHKSKPIIKKHLQDHPATVTPAQDYLLPSEDHTQPIAPFQDHKSHTVPISQDHHTAADVREIISLKMHFPTVLTLQAICQENIQYVWTPLYPQYNMPTEKCLLKLMKRLKKPYKNGR